MKRAYHSVLTVVALAIFTVSTANGQAEDYTYETNNGTITITGYTGPPGDAVIPETINGLPVTTIKEWAFSGCPNLTSVTISDSVTKLGAAAFACCDGLTNVILGSGVRNLEGSYFDWHFDWRYVEFLHVECDGLFFGCHNLRSITIPNTVTNIGVAVFWSCNALTNVTIPENVISIGEYAFGGCTSLTSITIPNSVTIIGEYAFGGCTSLTSITIPNSVTIIGEYAFDYCTSLTSVTIPDSVTNLGGGAFFCCSVLTTVAIGNGVRALELSSDGMLVGMFERCYSLVSITLGENVTSIAEGTFSFCNSLTNVTIPASLTNMLGAFSGCDNLIAYTVEPQNPVFSSLNGVLFDKAQSVLIDCPGFARPYVIPTGVTSIGPHAFAGSRIRSVVTIPDSVVSIGEHAFWGCENVYFQGNAPIASGEAFWDAPFWDGSGYGTTVYYLPGTTGWGTTFGGRPTVPWLLPSPVILTTAPNFGIQNDALRFRISWATNASVVVEGSANLANPVWSPISTNTLVNGWRDFSDAEWKSYPARFYRIRSQ